MATHSARVSECINNHIIRMRRKWIGHKTSRTVWMLVRFVRTLCGQWQRHATNWCENSQTFRKIVWTGIFFILLLNTFAIKSVLHGVDGGRTDRRILFRRRVVRFINFAIGYSTAFCVYHTVYLPRPLNFQIKFQFCITSSLAHNATDAIVCDCSGQTALVELSVAQRKPAAVEIESIRFNGWNAYQISGSLSNCWTNWSHL